MDRTMRVGSGECQEEDVCVNGGSRLDRGCPGPPLPGLAFVDFGLGRCLRNPPWIWTWTLTEIEQIRMAYRGARRPCKNCPRFLCENPKTRWPFSTGEFMYIPTASVFQTCSTDHAEPDLTGRTAMTPASSPEKTTTSWTRSGDISVPKSGDVVGNWVEKSLRHTRRPLSRSSRDRISVMPSV